MKISVLITTRNRCNDLFHCLNSVLLCRPLPFEIIVVDNGSSDGTEKMLEDNYSGRIKYFKELRQGIPFGRNASMDCARGDILSFIDDDCVVDKNWVGFIYKAFSLKKNMVGLIGKVENYLSHNPYAAVEQCWYAFWRLRVLKSLNKNQQIVSGDIIDFKNVAFKAEFIRMFKFNESMSVSGFGVEDREISRRILSGTSDHDRLVYYPVVKVLHKNSDSLQKILKRRFFHGLEMGKLEYTTMRINKRTYHSMSETNLYKFATYSIVQLLNVDNKFDKIIFILLFPLLPFVGLLGRLHFRLILIFLFELQNHKTRSIL